MSRNVSVTIRDHFDAFIDEQVANGRFESASEVLRAALRLLEDQEVRRETLRAALIEGETSGIAEDFCFDGYVGGRCN